MQFHVSFRTVKPAGLAVGVILLAMAASGCHQSRVAPPPLTQKQKSILTTRGVELGQRFREMQRRRTALLQQNLASVQGNPNLSPQQKADATRIITLMMKAQQRSPNLPAPQAPGPQAH
jgi:hypothetical protein